MKRLLLILKVLILLLMVPSSLYAYDFESGGIYYNNLGENNVSVTSGDTKYQGSIVIPGQVIYNGKTYSVTSIGKDSFKECSSLTSISIPNSVTNIGKEAFYYCTGLSTVTIPNSVTSIDDGAFYNCQKFTHITIPNSVTHIGYYVFSGCDLSSIKVESGNMYYDSRNDCNAIIETSSNTLITGLINTVIPNSVTAIGQHAFHACHDLTSVTIPKNIKSIGSRAFSWCNSLTSIKVESGNPQYDSRNNCNAIIETSSNTLIAGCKKTTIPNNIISIGSYAFHGCQGLTSIDIPNSVTNIGYCAFFSCKDLTSITILNSAVSIETDAFKGTAWYNNQPDGLVYIGKIAYKYKGEMLANTNVTIKNGTLGIANIAFRNCNALISIIIPNSVTSIGYKAFEGCNALTSVTIPNSVISIGNGAFYGCSGIKSVTIPNSVTHFGNFVFGGCSILSSITVESGNLYYDSRDDCNAVIETSSNTLITGLYNTVIPNSVTAIGDYAFYDCSNLNTATIPNSVKSIGKSAFAYCRSLNSVISKIEKPFIIDNTVFDIISYNGILTVPKGTKAAYQATEGWNFFANIIEAGDVEPDKPGQIHINDIFYKLTGSGEAEVVSVEEGETSVTIPSTISYNNNTYKVTSIAKEVFENREHLAAVIWEPEAQFNAKVNNPNFLLYVSDEKYASHTVKNVVVNGVAENIELTDAANGNDFYCPKAFKAKSIIYSHNYQMETGLGESKGWETIVLPFDVQKYTHATKGELESFTTWLNGTNKKPFWLFELTASGYKDVAGIKANTPYIISMPNNQQYEQQYQIPGVVTFSASDVEVQKSDNLKPVSYQGRSFVPNYTNQNNADFLALNVSNNYVTNPGKDISGSKFVRGLRAVHPFEAYMTTTDNTRSIDVMEGMTTAIRGIQMVKDESSTIKVYDTRGVLLKTATSTDDVKKGLKVGVYIVNGKKMIIK